METQTQLGSDFPEAMTATVAVAGLVATAGLAVAPIHVTVRAATHTPRINSHWPYAVRVMRDGKPVAGKITVQIVDPIGGVHPVEFGANTKKVTNVPVKGTFRDYMIFPASARGIPLKIRVTIVVGTDRSVANYPVTPQA
jgi:hypothetical protein